MARQRLTYSGVVRGELQVVVVLLVAYDGEPPIVAVEYLHGRREQHHRVILPCLDTPPVDQHTPTAYVCGRPSHVERGHVGVAETRHALEHEQVTHTGHLTVGYVGRLEPVKLIHGERDPLRRLATLDTYELVRVVPLVHHAVPYGLMYVRLDYLMIVIDGRLLDALGPQPVVERPYVTCRQVVEEEDPAELPDGRQHDLVMPQRAVRYVPAVVNPLLHEGDEAPAVTRPGTQHMVHPREVERPPVAYEVVHVAGRYPHHGHQPLVDLRAPEEPDGHRPRFPMLLEQLHACPVPLALAVVIDLQLYQSFPVLVVRHVLTVEDQPDNWVSHINNT